jgi:hypothetical protein
MEQVGNGLVEFDRWMPEYESLRWPIEMMKKGWINVQSVVRSITGWDGGMGGEASVSMVVVKGAGHHVQNDVQAERAAEVLRMFMGGL